MQPILRIDHEKHRSADDATGSNFCTDRGGEMSEAPQGREEARNPLSLGERFRQPQTLLSFLFAGLIVAFLVRRLDIDPGEVWHQIRSANPGLFGLGLIVYYLGFVARTIRWRRMLVRAGVDRDSEVSLPPYPGLMEIVMLSWFANCVVPAKLGDVYRGFLLKRRSNAPFTTTMGTIAAERLIDVVVLVVLLVGSGLLVFGRHFPTGTQTVVIYGGATVAVGVLAVIFAWLFRAQLLALLPNRFAAPLGRVQVGIFDNLRSPWVSIGLGVLIWLAEGARFFFVAWSLDVVLPGSTALFVALLSSLATVSPITPAGLGVVEALVISVLPLVGVAEDSAAAIAILDRVISYWSLIVIGLPLYILYVRRDLTSSVRVETGSTQA
ncbi:MAG: flippase-like domain-containing protein [Chloroflexota bacterium]|nr:flippase-like domain-containing protein [Chloroflexota bacterium]